MSENGSRKLFGTDGIRGVANVHPMTAELALQLGRALEGDSLARLRPTATEIGKAFRVDDADGRYNVFVKNTFPRQLTLDGLKVAVDCANGSAYKVAPEVLEELGAEVC